MRTPDRHTERAVLVAATKPELCGRAGLVCGVGPVEAAIATARALAERRPMAVLHVGIAGARRDSGLAVPSLALGERAVYEDLRLGVGLASKEAVPSGDLLARARGVLPEAAVVPIGTTAHVGGGTECAVEAMEGFSVLRACAEAGVPAIELRAISNHVEDARADWRIEEALAALHDAVGRLLAAFVAA